MSLFGAFYQFGVTYGIIKLIIVIYNVSHKLWHEQINGKIGAQINEKLRRVKKELPHLERPLGKGLI